MKLSILLAAVIGLVAADNALAQRPDNSLQLVFRTAGDDLRGGNDNVNVLVHLRNGRTLRFNNVNRGRNWPNNSTRTVSLRLPRPGILPRDVTYVTIQTTFRGGIAGDNWSMHSVWIHASAPGPRRYIGRHGPYRFTGDRRALSIRGDWHRPVRP